MFSPEQIDAALVMIYMSGILMVAFLLASLLSWLYLKGKK